MASAVLDSLRRPVVLAPMAGGPSTPALAAAVTAAGGLGFLAAGYLDPARLALELGAVPRPAAVNLFVPGSDDADRRALAEYGERLRPDAAALGVEPGEPGWEDDHWRAKLALVLEQRPAVVSFTFGCPERAVLQQLRAAAIETWVTVTSAAEAQLAVAAGADALVAQGLEAGGHRATFAFDAEQATVSLVAGLARDFPDVPIVAAGGISNADRAAAALEAGAAAVQAGSAFLAAVEAGTHRLLREALRTGAPTALTRAFTGRRARGLVNAFMERHEAFAPDGYPNVHHLTATIRAAARARGDASRLNLWAGAHAAESPMGLTAAEIVAELARAAR